MMRLVNSRLHWILEARAVQAYQESQKPQTLCGIPVVFSDDSSGLALRSKSDSVSVIPPLSLDESIDRRRRESSRRREDLRASRGTAVH